jgi:hypothetical protein
MKLAHLFLGYKGVNEMISVESARDLLDAKLYSLNIENSVQVTETGKDGACHHHVVMSLEDAKTLGKAWTEGRMIMRTFSVSDISGLDVLAEYMSKGSSQKKKERLTELRNLVDALAA